MFLVEYKDPPEVFTNLVVNKDECVIQYIDDDHISITEWVYPVIWHDDECEEISVKFDETFVKLLKDSNFFKVSKNIIEFSEISYEYTPGDIHAFETRMPELACVLPPTEWGIIGDGVITITDTFNVTSEKITFKFLISHLVKKFSGNLKIDFKYLQSLKSFTKVYVEENFPICLETLNPRKRVYIAPCFE